MILVCLLLVICIGIAAGLTFYRHGSDADWTDWPRDEVEW